MMNIKYDCLQIVTGQKLGKIIKKLKIDIPEEGLLFNNYIVEENGVFVLKEFKIGPFDESHIPTI